MVNVDIRVGEHTATRTLFHLSLHPPEVLLAVAVLATAAAALRYGLARRRSR